MKTPALILTLVAIFTYTYKEVSKTDQQPKIQTYSAAPPVITYNAEKKTILVHLKANPFCYNDLNAIYLNYLKSWKRGC